MSNAYEIYLVYFVSSHQKRTEMKPLSEVVTRLRWKAIGQILRQRSDERESKHHLDRKEKENKLD